MNLDEINKYLKARDLDPFQIQCILNQIHTYEKENESVKMITFDVCPKCGAENPKLIKAGKTSSGKQMFQCCQCNHRFVSDHGHVTFYSHQKHSKWLQLMEDTLTGVSLRKTAENIHVHPVTAFRMRHKFLRALEKSLDLETIISEVGEIDETYSRNNHKGKKIPGIESKKRGTPGKAGLSKDQVCIITAVGRNGGIYAKAYNMGKPSEDDAFNMADHIADHSYFFSDKTRCYDHFMYEKECTLHKVDNYH